MPYKSLISLSTVAINVPAGIANDDLTMTFFVSRKICL